MRSEGGIAGESVKRQALWHSMVEGPYHGQKDCTDSVLWEILVMDLAHEVVDAPEASLAIEAEMGAVAVLVTSRNGPRQVVHVKGILVPSGAGDHLPVSSP